MSPSTKESFVIEGLAGERRLEGSVRVNGAKNAALKAMAAAVLFDGPVELRNVPDTDDIHTLAHILKKLGATVTFTTDHTFTVTIDSSGISSTDIDSDLARIMRASVVLTGPMLGRFGRLTFPAPGGCVIGARPIDLFIQGYASMGATTREDELVYTIEAPKGIQGATLFFNKISVGATETLMMAAVLARGTTVLKNCAMEPEIINIAEWLNACGAEIAGVGTPTMTIRGTGGKLLSPKTPYVAIPDRIEAGSYLLLGALTAKRLVIENCRPDHMEALIHLLRDAGVAITAGTDTLTVEAPASAKTGDTAPFTSIADLRTHEYPGFVTDLQPPMTVFLTQARGESKMFETIYEGRFKYVTDLSKMGADITIMNTREIMIKGPTPFHALPDGEELNAHDIRAGFAIVMAALTAKGTFKVNNVHLIDRGYERLEKKLSALGANIKRVRA